MRIMTYDDLSGISVGSLGQYSGEYDLVENVTAMYVALLPLL